MTGLEFLIPRGVLLTGPPGVGKTFAVRSAVEAVRNMGSAGSGQGFQVQTRNTALRMTEKIVL